MLSPVCRFKDFSSHFQFVFTQEVGYVVGQSVEAVRYKPGGRGFDSRWCHWNFSLA
jgi:hypothetical protein